MDNKLSQQFEVAEDTVFDLCQAAEQAQGAYKYDAAITGYNEALICCELMRSR